MPAGQAAEARPLILSREQFESAWTGELLLFTKRANLRLQDLKFDFTWFIPAIVKYRKFLGEVLVASLFLQLFALLTPLYFFVILVGEARTRSAIAALLCGAGVALVLHVYAPAWSLFGAGFIGGTVAWAWQGSHVRRR